MKAVGRNAMCPCGSVKKYKRCCGMQRVESSPTTIIPSTVIPSLYQPLAAHGFPPWQMDEMIRFAERTRRAR